MPIDPQAQKATQQKSDTNHQKTDSSQALVGEGLCTESISNSATFEGGENCPCSDRHLNECQKSIHESIVAKFRLGVFRDLRVLVSKEPSRASLATIWRHTDKQVLQM